MKVAIYAPVSLAARRQKCCPRCGSPLIERNRARKWLPFFECQGCFLTFELVTERHFEPCGHNPQAKFLRHTLSLQAGRTPAQRSK